MKKIKLLSMHIQNFKGCKNRTIEFGDKTRISGANATGKTTIFDAFTWLLFERDSLGSSNFDIRPLDADGKMVDNIEISVESKISVDGKQKKIADYEARKTAYEAKYVKDKESFEKKRAENLARIEADGKQSAALRDELKAKEEELRNQMAEESKKLAEKQKTHNEAKEELNKYPITADVSENAEYLATVEKISVLEKEIEVMSADTSGKAELETKKAVLKNEIAEIAGKIMAADNTKVKARIAELEAEQKAIGQKIADQEQMIDLVEDFIRAKMNMISDKINGMFKIVSFKLFAEQINGGIKETCECTVNGVPLSSLNNGHRIVAGLDIIHSLSNLYGVSCPIFVDNAESINDFNVPEMDAQMIYLTVTDDKELKVESEDK